jgi:hypothetical protein
VYGYSKKEKIILYIFNIMEIPTYLFIIFCLSLVFINRKYLPISLILIALFLYYQRVNNSNVLLSKNGQLYINSYNKVESFQNYVPNQLGSVNLTSDNWNTICTSVNCENKDMTKESLKTVLDEFKTYIKDLTENDLNNIKGNLTGNGTPQWEFVTKQNVYNISHSHDTVGQLIYHLKNIDFNIFIQLFNKIGYEDDIIKDLYEKVHETLIKKEYLDIKDGDVISTKIKMVHDILKKINEEYREFQDNNVNKFNFSQVNTFNKIEQCKIVKQTTPYSEFSDDVFANKTLGCPTGHYLKGMSYNVNENTFTQNFHCCELKSQDYNQSYAEYLNSSSVFNDIIPKPNVVEGSILSNFSFDINKTDTELGNYEQTDVPSDISPNSIKISGFTDTGAGDYYSYERKIYLIYMSKIDTRLTSSEADAIIYNLNNVSSLKFIILDTNYGDAIGNININKTGFIKETDVNKIVNLANTALSTTEVGIFALVYGEKNHIKYAIQELFNKDIKLDHQDIKEIDPQSQTIKNIFNIEGSGEPTPTPINFNGIYNKNQNSFTNINNPLIVLNYNPKLTYWTLEYNKVPIYYYANTSTTTLSPMMKEVFDKTQLTEPKSYFDNAVFSGSPVIEDNTSQDIKKLLNIEIDGNDDYNGQYLFKQLVNNRPEYTKQDNALITIKWNNNPETRRWEITLSGTVKFTNTTNSVIVPVYNWKNDSADVTVTILNDLSTTNNLKDYIILTKSGNYLKPKLDILSKKFMLEDSQKPHTSQPGSVSDIYKFNIIKEIDNYYIKNIKANLFISITNDGNLILANEQNKTPLNLIKQNSRYLIRLPNENKLATLENLFLKMKPSFNVLNPESNQVFEFVNISSNDTFPVKANYGYYTAPVPPSASPSTVSLTIPEKMSGYNEKQIMCQNNEYVSQLLKSDDKIELKCNKIQEENPNNIKNTRISFFNKPISGFYHSHDFIVEDPIHNIEVNSTDSYDLNKYKSKLLGTQVELYSKRDGEYLNQSSLYSPLQKILIMMVMMKINNIDSVNLDTNSLFEYFSKQNIFDIYYNELLKDITLGPSTTELIEVTQAVEFYSSGSRMGKYKEYDDSTDLEFGYDGSKNIILLNFDISNISNISNITQATLKFYFDNNGVQEKQKNHLKIYGIKKNNYLDFKNEIDNEYTIPSNIYTNNYVEWAVTNYDTNGDFYPEEGLIESPDISNILNELVSTHSINNIFLLIVPDKTKMANITNSNSINNENILQAYGNIKAHDDDGKPKTNLGITYVS